MVSAKELDIEPVTMSIDEFTALLVISLTTAYEKTQRDALPVPRIPSIGRYGFSRQAYAELMARQHAVSEQAVTWDELYAKYGLTGERPPERSASWSTNQQGDIWLRAQPEDVQNRVLDSITAGDLFRGGDVELQDFVVIRRSERWWTTHSRGSARQALAKAERRRERDRVRRIDFNQMQPYGRINVGQTSPETVALVPGSVTRDVVIHERVRAHYRARHPEMQETDIETMGIMAIVNPEKAMDDRKYRDTVNVFRRISETEDVMVSLHISTTPGQSNRVKSMRTHPPSRTDELLSDEGRVGERWPDGGSANPARADTE